MRGARLIDQQNFGLDLNSCLCGLSLCIAIQTCTQEFPLSIDRRAAWYRFDAEWLQTFLPTLSESFLLYDTFIEPIQFFRSYKFCFQLIPWSNTRRKCTHHVISVGPKFPNFAGCSVSSPLRPGSYLWSYK